MRTKYLTYMYTVVQLLTHSMLCTVVASKKYNQLFNVRCVCVCVCVFVCGVRKKESKVYVAAEIIGLQHVIMIGCSSTTPHLAQEELDFEYFL